MTERLRVLLDVRRAQPISKIEPGSIRSPGVAAVWCRLEGLADLAEISGVLVAPIVFVGGAGGLRAGKPSRHMLDDRIRQHLHGTIGSSTLRRSVAALLLARERAAGHRPRLRDLEDMAGDWIGQQFLATWLDAPAQEVGDLVEEAVAAYQPQMNLPRVDTPFRKFLDTCRAKLDRDEEQGWP